MAPAQQCGVNGGGCASSFVGYMNSQSEHCTPHTIQAVPGAAVTCSLVLVQKPRPILSHVVPADLLLFFLLKFAMHT